MAEAVGRCVLALLVALPLAAPAVAQLHTPGLTCKAFDKNGREVYRSPARLAMFKRMSGYPKGRPGFHADHVVPLSCGGCDVPSNLAWVRVDLKKRKDAIERRPCNVPLFPWAEAIEANR